MVKDIVKRLKAHSIPIWTAEKQCEICLEAAEEIERLRGIIEAFRLTPDQLSRLLHDCEDD